MGPYIFIAILIFALWAGAIYWQYKRTLTEARLVFNAGLKRREYPENEPYAPFERAFLRTSDVRVGMYRWLATLSALIMIPIAVSLISFVWARAYYLADRPAWMTEGELVHSFFLAVGTMGALVGVAAIFTRRYHQLRPAKLDDEWEKEKAVSNQGLENIDQEPA